MNMSPACEAPQQPRCSNDEREHPRYREYCNYRAQLSAQLVQAPPFSTWLRGMEEFESDRETVFRTQPGAMIADGWYKHVFRAGEHHPERRGPFATREEAEAA